MSALTLFPKRVPEPEELNEIEMGAFEKLAQMNYKRWFLPLVDDFLTKTNITKGTVVDVACGPGLLSKELAIHEQKLSVIGIDISRTALHMARKNTKDLSNVAFKEGSVYQLPFKDNSVDAVICKDSLHHFDDLKMALSEMFRIVKPGGYMYIQDMRRDLPMYLIQRSVACSTPIEKLQYYSTRAAYTKEEVQKVLKDLNIKPISLSTPHVSKNLADRYAKQDINTQSLREGFQARYNLIVRK